MNTRMMSLGLPGAVLAASLVGACQHTARGIQQDAEMNAQKAKVASQDAADSIARASDEIRQKADHAVVATKDMAADATEKTKNAAASTAATLEASEQTIEIRAALAEDKSIDASGISVNTDGKTRIVTLKGTVPTATQKAAAGMIAKAKAPEYSVVNVLVVSPD
jgi:hypothetical protein